jgi:hypothetical protein
VDGRDSKLDIHGNFDKNTYKRNSASNSAQVKRQYRMAMYFKHNLKIKNNCTNSN